MAGCAGPELAAAVARAGGLGFLGSGELNVLLSKSSTVLQGKPPWTGYNARVWKAQSLLSGNLQASDLCWKLFQELHSPDETAQAQLGR